MTKPETVRCPACSVAVEVTKLHDPQRCLGPARGKRCPTDAMEAILAERRRQREAKENTDPTRIMFGG